MVKSVKLTKMQASRLLDWHGGQGSAVYALGSSSHSGHGVPIAVARAAIMELEQDLKKKPKPGFWSGWSARDKASLMQRIKDIQGAVARTR